MNNFKKIFSITIIILNSMACKSRKTSVNPGLLVGKWKALTELAPDIILDKSNYFMLLRGSTDIDTLNLSYTLNHGAITIYWGKQWVSKNYITKLDKDSLIYRRKGDNRIFKFKRE